MRPRVLMVAHVGETLGHVVRGLVIADALASRGAEVHIAAAERATTLIASNPYQHHAVPWAWSHNDLRWPVLPRQLSEIVRTNRALLDVMTAVDPDVVVSLPGVFTAQAAASLDLPHCSVAHGVYLSGLVSDRGMRPVAKAIIRAGRRYFERQGSTIWHELASALALPPLSYRAWLREAPLLVPDPFTPIPTRPNIARLSALRAGYGRKVTAEPGTCLVTFGSGNSCAIGPIAFTAAKYFPNVLVVGRHARSELNHPRIHVAPTVDSRAVAPLVRAVISHGGLGTVGTFLGLPQLLIATELDQATTALHAEEVGAADAIGLTRWLDGPALGRQLCLDHVELDRACARLAERTGVLTPTADISDAVNNAVLSVARPALEVAA